MRLIVIAYPSLEASGGSKRDFHVLSYYHSLGVEVAVYVPLLTTLTGIISDAMMGERCTLSLLKCLNELERKGIEIVPYIYEWLESGEAKKVRFISSNDLTFKFGVSLLHVCSNLNPDKRFLEKLVSKANSADCIYCMHETLDAIYPLLYLSSKTSIPSFLLLQLEPYNNIPYYSYRKTLIDIGFHRLKNILIKRIYRRLLSLNSLKAIFSVSSAPLKLSGLDKLASNKGLPTKILKPALAFNRLLLRYRRKDKEDYAVFFARLTPSKGIFDLPFIWKFVESRTPKTRLLICGRFMRRSDMLHFFNLLRKLRVKRVEYLGFLRKERLWEIISRAKVVVYPSHRDAFPLAVLESLALGTTVVAYDIPAMDVYRNLPPVHLVRKGSVIEMAKEVVRVLETDYEKYFSEHENSRVKEFLELHSSWRKVAEAELKEIKGRLRGVSI